ncbi:MAG: cation-translocating P-type ATPase [Phycisphaerae bacterium]|nr:cation-translocating P-type ATPase [Phycisphaerae bacterium]
MSHLASTNDVYKTLGISPSGLSESQVQERLTQHGPNELQSVARFKLLTMILSQFSNMFLILLLFASFVSWLTGAGGDALIIACIVLANATISFIQEYKAEQSLKSLQSMMADLTHVIRDGTVKRIPAKLIVPGDLVQVEAGDRVPADGVILECINGMVNESSLTGESVPVSKRAYRPMGEKEKVRGSEGKKASMEEDKTVRPSDLLTFSPSVSDLPFSAAEPHDEEKVFAGTTLSYGRLTFLVRQTGMGTRIGSIARVTTDIGMEKSPLQVELDAIGHRIARIAAGICLAVFLIMAVRYDLTLTSLKDAFLFAIALAVAIVPEGLPATVTIGLAFGMRKMARENAIIRKLSAVETLGCTTVICTDKTGTLTKNEMTVRAVYTAGEYLNVSGAGYEPQGDYSDETGKVVESADERLVRLLRLAALCNNAQYTAHTALGDPTEIALLVAAVKADVQPASLRTHFPRLDELPFDSDRRMMTTVHEHVEKGTFFSATKGAPDRILDCCTRYFDGRSVLPLDKAVLKNLFAVRSRMATGAMRVLAFAFKEIPTADPEGRGNLEGDMVFAGFIGMADPPRPDVEEAIRLCKRAGIRVIMTTGDQKETALAVARETGIVPMDDDQVILAQELRALSDAQLDHTLEQVSVFAQISPEDKMRLVESLKRQGEIVAMTGDGVNDAPALKRADIGVAMGKSGTDIAKDASKMVIADDSFSSIVTAVMEGRAIYDNIKKFILYAFSGITAEFFVVCFSLLPGVGQLLSAIQILWIDLGVEVLPALSLSMDPPAPGIMVRKPRKRQDRLIDKDLLLHVGFNSTIIAIGAVLLYFCYRWAGAPEKAATLPLVSMVLFQMFNIFNCRNPKGSILNRSLWKNRYVLGAVGISTLATVLLVSLPGSARMFHVTPLSVADWGIMAVVAASIIALNEVGKGIVYRRAA